MMTDQRSGLIRYYCTAGNGMERFLIDEVKKKLAAENVYQMPGKVLFSSSAGINKIRELKSAERLFLLLKQDSPVRLSEHVSPGKAASVLQSRLLGDRNEWASAVMTWSRLQTELASRRTTGITSSAGLGVMRKREEERASPEQEEEGESDRRRLRIGEESEAQTLENKTKMVTVKRGIEETSAGRKWKEETSEDTCGRQTLEKKRKRYDEEEERSGAAPQTGHGKNVDTDKTSEDSRREEVEQMGMFSGFSGAMSGVDFNGGSAPVDPSLESSSSTDDSVVQRVENVKSPGREDKTLSRSSSVEPELPSCFPVSFRISCKCTGSLSRLFSAQVVKVSDDVVLSLWQMSIVLCVSQEVSRVIGVGLGRLLGWKADLKNPQLEINFYLTDDHCLLGIPLTRIPLAKRSYIKTTGLRSTVAWAMASLAQIQPGFCVVDPMCGAGTILIEAAQEHKAAFFLGVDIDDGQLQKAKTNVEFAELGNRIHLLKASSMVLPLPSASVDAVVCDLPFGRKFGTRADMAANLPVIVTEMERVLRIGGTLVLLLSPQLSCLLRKLLERNNAGAMSNQKPNAQTGMQGIRHSVPPPFSSLRHEATLRVSLGVIDGLVHKYVKVDA